MTVSALIGYPVLFNVPCSPAPGVEEVISPRVMEYSLREHANVKLLLNHDAQKQLACLDDGTLKLTVDSLGVRVELVSIPSTPAGDELRVALDAGTIRGGSFGWSRLRHRWYLDRNPIRVEVVDALVSEVSIIIAPRAPRYRDTWARALSPQMAALYRRLDAQWRYASPPPAEEPAADLTLTPPRPNFGIWAPLMRLLQDPTAPEHRAVMAAARENPNLRIVDARYARTLRSCKAVMDRRFPPPPPIPAPPKRTHGPKSNSGGMLIMDTPMPIERRPAPGFCGTRSGDYDVARHSLEKFKAEHEARVRGSRGALSVSAARARLAQQAATFTHNHNSKRGDRHP